MIRNTVEYLKFYLLSDLGEDISSDPVQAALELTTVDPDTYTWLNCTFISASTVGVVEDGQIVQKARTDWRTTAVVTFNDTNYPESSYAAYARATDSPEIPITKLGTLNINR